MVYEKAISQVKSEKVRILVVWTPRYPGDNRNKAVAAANIVPDSRATHFWDSHGTVSKLYGDVLNLPDGKRFAWDTYMIFSAEAAWTEDAPVPAEWMHQLGALGKDHPRWLDADRFLKTLRRQSSGNESQAGVANAKPCDPNL